MGRGDHRKIKVSCFAQSKAIICIPIDLSIAQIKSQQIFKHKQHQHQHQHQHINMGGVISFFLVPICEAILVAYSIVPFSVFWTYKFIPTGLLKLIIHRYVLNKNNLYRSKSCLYFYVSLIWFCVGLGEHYFAMEQMSLYPKIVDLIIVPIT